MIFGLKWLILGWDGKLIDLKSFLPPFTSFLPHMCRKKSLEKKKDFVCHVEWKMVWNVERKCRLFEKMDSVPIEHVEFRHVHALFLTYLFQSFLPQSKSFLPPSFHIRKFDQRMCFCKRYFMVRRTPIWFVMEFLRKNNQYLN